MHPVHQEDIATNPSRIKHHTWYGKTCHIVRKQKNNLIKLVRCEIGEIVLEPCFVGINVRFYDGDRKLDEKAKKKNYCPTYLTALNLSWASGDILQSDDEQADTFIRPTVLPSLRISDRERHKINTAQMCALEFYINQCDDLQLAMTPSAE